MTTSRTFALVLAAALAPACTSDPGPQSPQCTLIGEANGLHLTIAVTGAPLAPDFYDILVDGDGQQLTLGEVIQPGVLAVDQRATSTIGDKHFDVEGWLAPTAGDLQIGYREGGGPAHIDVDISNSKGLVVHAAYVPVYHEDQPNGPGCLPDVFVDGASLTITP